MQRTLLDLLTSKNVTPVEFDQEVALKARELRLRKIVTPARDAIHLASAIVAAADVLMTWDGKDFPLGRTIEGVYVSEPYLLGDPDLFTGDSQAESGPATR